MFPPKPPMPSALGLRAGSQAYRIYALLVTAYLNDKSPRVPIRVMLAYVKTTNHRARICKMRKLLEQPHIVEKYGKWRIPLAVGKGSDSSYWLERSA